jgi:uncharacterized membrane protein HdeD (DUF308 family)
MSAPSDPAVTRYPAVLENRYWLQLLIGVLAIAVGAAAFAWPSATVQVIGLLFGLNLLVTGLVRAGLLLFVPGYPPLYRVLGVVFGVLTAIVGVLCLLNLTASLVVLLVFVAIGWLLDGLVQIFVAVGGPKEAGGGWRIGTGLLLLLGGIAVLVWPRLGLATFVAIGGTVLLFVGIGHVVTAVAGLRAARRAPA